MYYTFKCPEHGEFEVNISYKDLDKVKCPQCEKEVERVYTPIMDIWNCGGAYGGGNR